MGSSQSRQTKIATGNHDVNIIEHEDAHQIKLMVRQMYQLNHEIDQYCVYFNQSMDNYSFGHNCIVYNNMVDGHISRKYVEFKNGMMKGTVVDGNIEGRAIVIIRTDGVEKESMDTPIDTENGEFLVTIGEFTNSVLMFGRILKLRVKQVESKNTDFSTVCNYESTYTVETAKTLTRLVDTLPKNNPIDDTNDDVNKDLEVPPEIISSGKVISDEKSDINDEEMDDANDKPIPKSTHMVYHEFNLRLISCGKYEEKIHYENDIHVGFHNYLQHGEWITYNAYFKGAFNPVMKNNGDLGHLEFVGEIIITDLMQGSLALQGKFIFPYYMGSSIEYYTNPDYDFRKQIIKARTRCHVNYKDFYGNSTLCGELQQGTIINSLYMSNILNYMKFGQIINSNIGFVIQLTRDSKNISTIYTLCRLVHKSHYNICNRIEKFAMILSSSETKTCDIESAAELIKFIDKNANSILHSYTEKK